MFEIVEDDLSGAATRNLLAIHLNGMSASSPPGSIFATEPRPSAIAPLKSGVPSSSIFAPVQASADTGTSKINLKARNAAECRRPASVKV